MQTATVRHKTSLLEIPTGPKAPRLCGRTKVFPGKSGSGNLTGFVAFVKENIYPAAKTKNADYLAPALPEVSCLKFLQISAKLIPEKVFYLRRDSYGNFH